MSYDHAENHAFALRGVAERTAQPPLRQIARGPGVRAVYRVTVGYHDRRAYDSVATLIQGIVPAVQLTLAYDGLNLKPMTRELPAERGAALNHALATVGFDALRDQPRLPQYGLDLWLVERGAAGFSPDVIVAPATATGHHADLVAAVRAHLPEALRAIAR